MKERFLSLKQVCSLLNITDREVKEFIETKQLSCYKIAGQLLRFKKEDVIDLRRKLSQRESEKISELDFKPEDENSDYTFTEKLVDFLYFNDFYILSILIIFLILSIIFLEVF